MKSLALFVCLASFVYATKIIKHDCIHNKISHMFEQNVEEYNYNTEERHLQATVSPRKMKFTYDMSWFDKHLDYNITEHVQFRENAEKSLKIALSYLSDLIYIKPKPIDSMKFNATLGYCSFIKVPQADTLAGKDSDLHLYISFTEDPQESYLAFAGWCRMLYGIGPTHGIVNFNYGLLKTYNYTNPLVFQDMIEIVIHEITHVLGFSGSSIKYWVDQQGKPYENATVTQVVRGLNTTFLRTPNVLLHAKGYYGCYNLTGMPLENQGGSGSASSHWESTAILDEIMNGVLSNNQAVFSRLTTSLLRDTGFYSSINSLMEEKSFFGKDEGCNFIMGECSTFKREFCQAGQIDKCDYYYYGTSKCGATQFFDTGCYMQRTYQSARCYDPNTNLYNYPSSRQDRGTGFGENSRCFMSSLKLQNQFSQNTTIPEVGLCYNFECNAANQVTITVGNQNVTCSQNGQKLVVPGFNGIIECPEKLSEFCAFKQFCPNHCSTNGYCINKKCKCLPKFKGPACDIPV